MNNKIIVYVSVLLVVIMGIFYFFRSSNKIEQIPNTQQTTLPTNNLQPTTVPPVTVSPKTTKTTSEVISTKTYNVSVISFSFNPGVLNIKKGDSVVWVNQDSAPHQIAGGNLRGPVMSKGQSYTFVFNSVGTFDYYCAIHPSMKGVIVVSK